MQSETPIPLSLSPSQAAIVDAIVNGEGNLAVLAAAGSGKTHTVAAAVVALVKKGVPLSSILVVTFGKAACIELHDRIAPHVNRKSWASYGQVEYSSEDDEKHGDKGPPLSARCARTFHSLALQFTRAPMKVRKVTKAGKNGEPDETKNIFPCVDCNGYSGRVWARALSAGAYDNYQFADYHHKVDAGAMGAGERDEDEELAAWRAGRDGLNGDDRELVRNLNHFATLMYAEGIRPGTAESAKWLAGVDPKINDLFIRFNSAVASEGFYTFGDKLIGWHAMNLNYQYQYVIIDEAQDNDPIQTWLARKLAKNGRLILVGDLRQAIHEWKGASPQLIEDFMAEPTTRTLHLSENRRSVPSIVALGNAIVEPYSYGKTPAIATRSETPGRSYSWGVVRKDGVENMVNVARWLESSEEKRRAKAQCAVLTRTWTELLRYEVAAFTAGIRYTMSAAKRKISPKKCRDLLAMTAKSYGPWLGERGERGQLDYWQEEQRKKGGGHGWEAVFTKARTFKSREDYRTWVEAYFDKEAYVPLHLGTAHTSKGMTIDTVIVVCSPSWPMNQNPSRPPGSGWSDPSRRGIPTQRAPDEDRLFYVAVTRAQNGLVIALPPGCSHHPALYP